MEKLKIGLLPLYVELYDIACPEVRPDIDAAHEYTIRRLREQDLELARAVQDFTDPTTGRNFMLFPIRRL